MEVSVAYVHNDRRHCLGGGREVEPGTARSKILGFSSTSQLRCVLHGGLYNTYQVANEYSFATCTYTYMCKRRLDTIKSPDRNSPISKIPIHVTTRAKLFRSNLFKQYESRVISMSAYLTVGHQLHDEVLTSLVGQKVM